MRRKLTVLAIVTAILVQVGIGVKTATASDVWANNRLVHEVLNGQRNEANVAWWGFDPEDSTQYVQAAINSGVSKLVIPNMGSDWVVRPIFLRSDLELILEEGVVLTAKKGDYTGTHESVLNALDVINVTITGYGAMIRMQKEDYMTSAYKKGEWRHAINIRGSKNVEISGLTIRDTGGDAIYLGTGSTTFGFEGDDLVVLTGEYNENIVVRDIITDNSHRQGISIISAKNVLIEDSVFKNTNGTRPMSGVDLEPNRSGEILESIVIRNSVFDNNAGPGIIMHLNNLDHRSEVSITWENILIIGGEFGVSITLNESRPNNQPTGQIVIRNCVIQDTDKNAVRVRGKNGDGLQIHFENCIFYNPVRESVVDHYYESVPIHLWSPETLDGIRFTNVVVADDQNRPALLGESRRPDGQGLIKLDGKIDVFNSHNVGLRLDGNVENNELTLLRRSHLTLHYEQYVSHLKYHLPPIIDRVKPAISFDGLSSSTNTTPVPIVGGQIRPLIRFSNFDEDDIQSVEVFFDGHSVHYSSKLVDETLEIDVSQLADGTYEMTAHVDIKDGSNLRESIGLCVLNTFENNRMVNGGFECDLLGWTIESAGNPEVVVDDSIAANASRSLKTRGRGFNDRVWVRQSVPIDGGKEYYLEAMMRSGAIEQPGGNYNDSPYIRIRYFDGQNRQVGSTVVLQPDADTSVKEWTPVGFSLQAPLNAQHVEVALTMNRATGTVWWDDISLHDLWMRTNN